MGREMLRIKRSVQHQYNTQVNMMSAQMLSGELAQDTPVLEASGAEPALPDSMKELDKENVSKNFVSFVRGEAQSKAVLEAEKEANPDEIDIDEDDPVAKKSKIEQQDVPSEVFGGLKRDE